MRKRNPDGLTTKDRWLQGIGVSRDLLVPVAQVLRAVNSVSAAPAPPAKSPPPGAVLKSIAVGVAAPLEPGFQEHLTAMGTLSDGSTQDLTSSVTWSSSDPQIVTVAPGGLAKVGSGPGTVTITASAAGGGVSGSITVTIRLPLEEIIVSPQNPLVENGQIQGLTATAVYSGGSTEDITDRVLWESSAPKVVDFTSDGWCVGNVAGTATVRATHAASQISGFTKITVPAAGKVPALRKVTISPLNPDIKDGTPVQFKAMGAYSDGSTHEIAERVKWEPSDQKILAIDSKGVAKGGLVSGNPLIRGSDPATGLYQSTTVYVAASGVQSISVSPKNLSIVSGDAVVVTATAALFGGGARTVNDLLQWTSSDLNVATMLPGGAQVQGHASGDATIEAVDPTSGSSDIISITVLRPVLRSIMVFPGGETIPNGQKVQFKATGFLSDRTSKDLTKLKWTSSAPDVIEIDQKGEATAKTAGKVTITAAYPTTGVTASVEMTAGANGDRH